MSSATCPSQPVDFFFSQYKYFTLYKLIDPKSHQLVLMWINYSSRYNLQNSNETLILFINYITFVKIKYLQKNIHIYEFVQKIIILRFITLYNPFI